MTMPDPKPMPPGWEPFGGDWERYHRTLDTLGEWAKRGYLSELAASFIRYAINDDPPQALLLDFDVAGRRRVTMNGVRYTVGGFEEELKSARRAKLN